MATMPKLANVPPRLEPALKEFLDAVVIPALVKEYLEEHRGHRLVIIPDGVSKSVAKVSASAEGIL